jgi:hypothetical protein
MVVKHAACPMYASPVSQIFTTPVASTVTTLSGLEGPEGWNTQHACGSHSGCAVHTYTVRRTDRSTIVSRWPHSFISILLVEASHTMASKLKPAPTITSDAGAYTALRMPVSLPVSSACAQHRRNTDS